MRILLSYRHLPITHTVSTKADQRSAHKTDKSIRPYFFGIVELNAAKYREILWPGCNQRR